MNWKDEIVKLVYVKQALAAIDASGLWPHHLPNMAADYEKIVQTENALGFKIDPGYSDFLQLADGWNGFYQTVDLFGTSDLAGNGKAQYAASILNAIDDAAISESGFQRQELFPIAATSQDKDIFAMAKPGSETPGAVVWFSGGMVAKFPNFGEFFLAMVDYNREEIEYFKGLGADNN
ncbi:SMI1/KNR4 family protein [Massilia sp. erpn]|uniref:SMI1/KNR4 family protein n=1 Tax=Massilia sp. erpn TaxID=2738142 RepID=UPI0021069B51|nr:SMI1/KNR4 family protein [Massilia sp. erpn]UTY59327.1 SMI1/KNR4 family protein [Massilia sp. erpn]